MGPVQEPSHPIIGCTVIVIRISAGGRAARVIVTDSEDQDVDVVMGGETMIVKGSVTSHLHLVKVGEIMAVNGSVTFRLLMIDGGVGGDPSGEVMMSPEWHMRFHSKAVAPTEKIWKYLQGKETGFVTDVGL
ncbi:hypothetical protein QJS10_CPB18g01152 [Acorus calamus]|uniref:Uncharacterized protein n=1 Tax=Acorus calamus TaxID=4465 RepID=A0AAV9CJ10_ACOCL|nr:hypothetical protein QJS10_CPB18g01152 [Acorus calamus]